MPTGYTAKLMENGQTFEEFTLQCARNFGALIMLRDEPMDAPIPEKFEPSEHYEKTLAEHQAKLTELQTMSEAERLTFGEKEQAKKLKMLEDWLEKDRAANEKLSAMRREVLQWTPPSADHQGLKEFMLDQIRISTNSLDYIHQEISRAKSKSPHGFWVEAVASEAHSVQFYAEESAKEIDRVRQRNLWIKQLRESLTDHEQTVSRYAVKTQ